MAKTEEPTVLFGKSKWIWAAENDGNDSNIILRRVFALPTDSRPPARAFCRVACDTHYYLYVNGNAVVWEGGLNRGKSAYYDEFDIAKYLIKGENAIVAYCRYYSADGRDLVTSGKPGFIFECNDLGIFSDAQFVAYENPAYKKGAVSNCCYAGSTVVYDASLEGQIQNVLDPTFKSSLFVPATVGDGYPDAAHGVLLPRPVPLERFSASPVIARPKKVADQFSGDTYTIALPREMRVTPYFELAGEGQEKVLVYTDRSDCQGCFGDEKSIYRGHTLEYTTKPTLNVFEGLVPMTGSELIFVMPRTVRAVRLGYREIGYNAERSCAFSVDDGALNALFDKAVNTLYCSMGSTLMDTPERERMLWMGDGSIAARALYLAYADAAPLVRKAIGDILDHAENDVLYSCVPGNVPVDIPSHGLIALGEHGIFAQYRNFTGDASLFRTDYSRLCDYLMLWEMSEHGVVPREGNRRWYDNLYNVDETLVENALYYSACKFLLDVGAEIGEHEYDETFGDRMDNIAEFIESAWDGLGYTTLGDAYDDRANALVALCGLVPDDRREAVARLLAATLGCSPYFEWAAVEALAALGRSDLALKRFTSRYAAIARSEDTTLGEDFNGFGTKCQSYQTAVVSELIQVFGGIDVRKGASLITVSPDFAAFREFKCSVKLATGELDVKFKNNGSRIDLVIENGTTAKLTLDVRPELVGRPVERRTIVLNKGKNKFSI